MKKLLAIILLLIPIYGHCGFVTGMIVGSAMSSGNSTQSSGGGRVGADSYLVLCDLIYYSQCRVYDNVTNKYNVVFPNQLCGGKYLYNGEMIADRNNLFVVCTLPPTPTPVPENNGK